MVQTLQTADNELELAFDRMIARLSAIVDAHLDNIPKQKATMLKQKPRPVRKSA